MNEDKICLASDVIKRLQELVTEHGDLPIMLDDPDTEWRLPIGIVYRPKSTSRDKTPRFEIKAEYHMDPDGLIGGAR